MARAGMTHPIIRRRRAEQKKKISVADHYIRGVARRLDIERAWVVGSVARGDFNVWSDIDVVVVARVLPLESLRRADLFLDGPPTVQVVAYTPQELEVELGRKNPLAVEASTIGIPIGNAAAS
jgi:predicted nucleotidyltransferase